VQRQQHTDCRLQAKDDESISSSNNDEHTKIGLAHSMNHVSSIQSQLGNSNKVRAGVRRHQQQVKGLR